MIKIIILGLLSQRNLSGYEIIRYLELSSSEKWAKIKIGSIYHSLKMLEKNEMIKVESIENSGKRTKTIYSILEKGSAFFEKELEKNLSTADLTFPGSLYTSITFLEKLPKDVAIKSIDKQLLRLREELEIWMSDKKEKERFQQAPLPKYMEALFRNGAKHIEADIELLEEIKKCLDIDSFEIILPELNK